MNISDKILEIPTTVRPQAHEVLFEGDEENNTVATLVLESLKKVTYAFESRLT